MIPHLLIIQICLLPTDMHYVILKEIFKHILDAYSLYIRISPITIQELLKYTQFMPNFILFGAFLDLIQTPYFLAVVQIEIWG